MATTTLLSLPSELFEIIATDVAPKDLKSLRLVSRESNFKTLAIFSRNYFPHQAFYLNSQRSLELAVAITQHAAFAQAIKTITFLIEEVQIRSSLATEIETARRARMRATEAGADISRYITLEAGLEKHFANLQKEKAFQSNGVKKTLLRQIFINLVGSGNLLKVELADVARTKRDPLVLASMEGFVYRTPLSQPACRDARPFTQVTKALEYARSHTLTPREQLVPTLAVHANNWALLARRLRRIPQFEGIQNLDIRVCVKGNQEQLVPFIKSIEHAASGALKTLKLHISRCKGPKLDVKPFTASLLNAVFPNIGTIELTGASATINEITHFAKRQPLLQQMNLTRCEIVVSKGEFDALGEDGEVESLLAVEGVRGTYRALRYVFVG